MSKKAIVLLSGGLDSATVLAIAQQAGYECYTLAFDYGQRHIAELKASEAIAKAAKVKEHRTLKLDLSAFGGSALTDMSIPVPDADPDSEEIPVTYVPARNTVFMSMALAWAEVVTAHTIYIGVNAVDYSGYPDCRPTFIAAFERMASLGTCIPGLQIHTPLAGLGKADIVQWGARLGVDYSRTVSCYQANAQGEACGHCDSCYLRKQGFEQAQVADPTRYQ